MSKRVSHSLLDPYLGPPLKALYLLLGIWVIRHSSFVIRHSSFYTLLNLMRIAG